MDNRELLLKSFQRHHDFPKKGVEFVDFLPLLASPHLSRVLFKQLAQPLRKLCPDKIVGIQSRGFLLGMGLANQLGIGFVPIRKKGKLPGQVLSCKYQLQYGEDCVQIKTSSLKEGQKVVLCDDILATGGTIEAGIELVEKTKAELVGVSLLMQIVALKGRSKIQKRCKNIMCYISQ